MSLDLSFLKTLAPALATAFGGPLAGMAVTWAASKLGVDEDKVQQTIAGMTGADLVKMKELDLEFQKHMADNGIALDMAQIQTNTEEAKSESIFVAGWRPFVGWICGLALLYVAILEPIARFAAVVWFHYTGAFPVIDWAVTSQVLIGMLGFGWMRSQDKKAK